ncbi:MAG: phosphate acetyltransferase [Porticoccaceae bacterium]
MTTPQTVLAKLHQQAKDKNRRIIFPEQSDPRVIDAISGLVARGLCTPVVIDAAADIPPGCEVFSARPDAAEWREKAARLYAESRRKNNLSIEAAREALKDPLLLASVLLKAGYVDGGIAGSLATTADVLRAGIRGVGLAPGTNLVSSIFLMEWPERAFTFGDCAVNPAPSAEQLARIAIDSAASHRKLTGETPRVGLLSFSTKGSAEHESVDRVRQALAIIRAEQPDLAVDGELQFDAALMPEVAAKKAAGSPVAGNCNVFIFPDLNAGNIGYKIAERLGGASAIGPILQGMAAPWLDLSRGCKPADIIDAAAIAAVLSD